MYGLGGDGGERGSEISVVDELWRVWLREPLRDAVDESLTLNFAVGAEAGGGLDEVLVVVAGVADELEDALVGKGVENLREGGGREIAGGGDAEGAGCCLYESADAGLLEFLEVGFEVAEEGELGAAEWAAMAEVVGPAGFKGVADSRNAGLF